MEGTNSRFVDDLAFVHLEPLPSPVPENALLYSATNWFLGYRDVKSSVFDHTVMSCLSDGYVYERPDKRSEKTSHDNMTGVVAYLHSRGYFTLIDRIKPFSYPHPRDFIWLGYVQRRWWSYPLLPLLFVVFLWTSVTKYKVRNGVKILKTDTEILYWIRLQIAHEYSAIWWMNKLIEPIMLRRFGVKTNREWIEKMMEIYYKNPSHPNRRKQNDQE